MTSTASGPPISAAWVRMRRLSSTRVTSVNDDDGARRRRCGRAPAAGRWTFGLSISMPRRRRAPARAASRRDQRDGVVGALRGGEHDVVARRRTCTAAMPPVVGATVSG